MNMMKNANNTTKTKLLTLLCKELKDSNESIAITNHYLLSSQSPPSLLFFFFGPLSSSAGCPRCCFAQHDGRQWRVGESSNWPLEEGKRRQEEKNGRVRGSVTKVPLLLHLEKEGINENSSKPVVRSSMPLLCGLFHLKSGLRKPHPPIFLLELFPSGEIFSVWLRKSTFNLLLYARTPTPIRTLANELSKMFLIKTYIGVFSR